MPFARPRCQCMASCKHTPLPGLPFCKKHSNKCPRISHLSGSEPKYRPNFYNKTRRIKDSHNCFAYAFRHVEIPPESECNENECSTPFHQPGRSAGFPKWHEVKGKRCPDLLARILAEVPGARPTTFESKCPRGYYKIAYVVSPTEDYHFYRKDKGRWWSHKPGASDVKQTDATGRLIYDPGLAARDYRDKYGRLNYDRFCGYLCVPRRTHTFKRGGRKSSKSSNKQQNQTRCQKRAF